MFPNDDENDWTGGCTTTIVDPGYNSKMLDFDKHQSTDTSLRVRLTFRRSTPVTQKHPRPGLIREVRVLHSSAPFTLWVQAVRKFAHQIICIQFWKIQQRLGRHCVESPTSSLWVLRTNICQWDQPPSTDVARSRSSRRHRSQFSANHARTATSFCLTKYRRNRCRFTLFKGIVTRKTSHVSRRGVMRSHDQITNDLPI